MTEDHGVQLCVEAPIWPTNKKPTNKEPIRAIAWELSGRLFVLGKHLPSHSRLFMSSCIHSAYRLIYQRHAPPRCLETSNSKDEPALTALGISSRPFRISGPSNKLQRETGVRPRPSTPAANQAPFRLLTRHPCRPSLFHVSCPAAPINQRQQTPQLRLQRRNGKGFLFPRPCVGTWAVFGVTAMYAQASSLYTA